MPEEEAQPTVERRRRRISSVWIVPLVALGLASWLVWENYSDQGPLASVSFETAEGLAAGKSEVRCRSVTVGIVENIHLGENLDSVVVDLRLDSNYAKLLKEDSRFWVVRPRVSASNVSGLGTLISGSYVELEPGEGPRMRDDPAYTGLEEPPVTGGSVPGLKLTLEAREAGSLSVGAPIYYRGFEVGKVERRTLDLETRTVRFDIFINESYSSLVHTNSRFWNTSGIDVTAGADGFKFRTPSLQALVSGGASFTTPPAGTGGQPAENGRVFTLHADESDALDSSFNPDTRALLFFDQSVRGLKPGAPVEFRGIAIGRVVEISFKYGEDGDSRVPVLVELDTSSLQQAARLPGGDGEPQLRDAVDRGLRASLGTGSLLTGALFVDLDVVSDAAPAMAAEHADFPVIPTHSSGLAQLEARVNHLLAKIEALPLEDTLEKFGNAADETVGTLAESRKSLDQLESTLDEIRGYIAADSTQNLPKEINQTLAELQTSVESLGPRGQVQGDLRRTLDELRAALRSFSTLSNSIEEKPNSLLFGRDNAPDPIPRAKR